MRSRFVLLTTSLLAFASLAPKTPAAFEEWKDTQGNSFTGEPVESLGPLALFRTPHNGGRMLAWRFLTPAECGRFYEQSRKTPPRAEDWTLGKGIISRELAGKVLRVQSDKLVPAETAGRPEPEFYVLFFANNGVSRSWDMLGHSGDNYYKLQQTNPNMVDGVFIGMRHTISEHKNMALSMKLPWLVTDFYEQGTFDIINRFVPVGDEDAYGLTVVTRDGVPVFSAISPDDTEVAKVFANLTALLELMRPGNPKSWPDRAHYQRAIQPAAYATGRVDPVLVGNPLVAKGLQERKITQVDAVIEVAADGAVAEVTIKPDTGVPANLIAPLSDALKKACVFVQAVDNGKSVAGTYHYHLEVPH
jgi:hypothetical protein